MHYCRALLLSLASLALGHLLLDTIQRIHQVVSVSSTFHLDSVSMRKRFIYHSFLFAISSTNLSSSKAPLLPHGVVSTSIHVACFSELHGSRVCSSRAASIMPCRVRHISGSRGLTGRQFNSSLTGKLPLHFGLLPIPLRRRGKSLDTPAKETETETEARRRRGRADPRLRFCRVSTLTDLRCQSACSHGAFRSGPSVAISPKRKAGKSNEIRL